MFKNEIEFEQLVKWLCPEQNISQSHQAKLANNVLSEFRYSDLRRSKSDIRFLQYALIATIFVSVCIIAMVLIKHSNKTSDYYFFTGEQSYRLPQRNINTVKMLPEPEVTATAEPNSIAQKDHQEQYSAESMYVDNLLLRLMSIDPNSQLDAIRELSELSGAEMGRLLAIVIHARSIDVNNPNNPIAIAYTQLLEQVNAEQAADLNDANQPVEPNVTSQTEIYNSTGEPNDINESQG